MKQLNRREFLKLGAILAGGAAIAACAPAAAPAPAAPAATAAPAAAAPKATDAPKAAAPAAGGKKKLEIFSWWTSGGEIEALNALLDPFKKKYPDVEVVNCGHRRRHLFRRRHEGRPPDPHDGRRPARVVPGSPGRRAALAPTWLPTRWNRWTSSTRKKAGTRSSPSRLIDIASKDGKPYSVPVNIHRANVLWYNNKMLDGHRRRSRPRPGMSSSWSPRSSRRRASLLLRSPRTPRASPPRSSRPS